MKQKNMYQLMKRFSSYLKPHRKKIFWSLLCGILGGSSGMLMTYYIGKAVDTMVGKHEVHFSALFTILFLIAGLLIVSALSQWLIQRLANQVAYQAVGSLRKDLSLHLSQLPLKFYDQTSHGSILSRFINDLDFVSEAFIAIFNMLFSGLTIIVISFFAMLWLSPLLTLVVLVTTPMIFIINWLITKIGQKQFAKQQDLLGQIMGLSSEMIAHQDIVKAFQQEERVEKNFQTLNQSLYHWGQRAQLTSSLTNPLARFIDHLTYIGIGFIGGFIILKTTGNITVGVISSFTIYSSQFAKPFIDLSGISTQIQTARAGLEQAFELLDIPVEERQATEEKQLTNVLGNIRFEHVYFSYQADRPFITDFNLEVKAGQTVAIVGKTGAGKSTLVNLLMRFYELTSGTIYIDDVPITQYSKDSLRQAFGMVLQDTWLFDGTIRENLLFGNPNASEEEMIQAAKQARIHSFIEKLPQGYDTKLNQQEIEISAGQKQLLTIARTMIAKPAMLILDEATSSVDTLTEKYIQDAFLTLMNGKTSFVIAHRLVTIQNADIILVIENGNIVETGTHEELLQKENGYYNKLYQAQFTPSES